MTPLTSRDGPRVGATCLTLATACTCACVFRLTSLRVHRNLLPCFASTRGPITWAFVATLLPTSFGLFVGAFVFWRARRWMWARSVIKLMLVLSFLCYVGVFAVPLVVYFDQPEVLSFQSVAALFLGLNVRGVCARRLAAWLNAPHVAVNRVASWGGAFKPALSC